jgi:hypothetical protein
MIKKINITLAIITLFVGFSFSQTSFSGFNYQAVIKDGITNIPFFNQSVILKVYIRKNNSAGVILFNESHLTVTNANGYVSLVIGQGTVLGGAVYSTFAGIDWQDSAYFCNLLQWDNTLSQYNMIGSKQIFAVPFSLYSKKTAQPFYLNKLSDIDTAGISSGSVLKWNGLKWVIATDLVNISDTVSFAYNSANAVHADTAAYAINAQNIIPSDTSNYAISAGNANYATNSNHAVNADSATYSSNAGIANFANNTWRTTGNAGTNSAVNFLGTTDATDLIIKTNDTARVVIKSTGKIGIGTSAPTTDLHVVGNNGVLFQGTFGSGTIPIQGLVGSRFMWYPKKAAFRGGSLDAGYSTYWDDANIGNYSFTFGKNSRSTGQFAVSFGEQNSATGGWSVALGQGSSAIGDYSFAAGQNAVTYGIASVSLGRDNVTRGLGSAGIGYHTQANGDYSIAFGYYTEARKISSMALGYNCVSDHNGAFIYSDFSGAALFTTAANQFMVRASGGFIFYSNPTSTAGVSLAAGSGSWASLSDSTKKENFELVNYNDVLEKVRKIKVYTWNYKTQATSIRHIGPTAQEFSRLFGLGENNTTINTVDIDGVNMAAIKALAEKTALLEAKGKELEQALNQIKQLKNERALFKSQLDELEKQILNLTAPSIITVKK